MGPHPVIEILKVELFYGLLNSEASAAIGVALVKKRGMGSFRLTSNRDVTVIKYKLNHFSPLCMCIH